MLVSGRKDLIGESAFPINLEVEAEFKFALSETHKHLKAYLGLKHSSVDGWRFLMGFKVAGIKVKLPVYLLDKD